MFCCFRRQRLGALVGRPFDPHALVCRPRHHAGSGEERVVDGIERDVGVIGLERDADYHDVVNVVQIIADALFSDAFMDATYDEVASRS